MSEEIKKGESRAGAKPPKSFEPIPKSSKGGYRKKMPNGGYVYWYPDGKGKDGAARGKFTTEKHKDDKGSVARQVLVNFIDGILPPDKFPYKATFEDLVDQAIEANKDKSSEETPKAGAEEPDGEKTEKDKSPEESPEESPDTQEPDPNAELREELEEEQQKLKDAAEAAQMERDLQETRAAIEALVKLAPGITDEEVSKIEAAVEKKFGKKDKKPAEEKVKKSAGLFQSIVDEIIKARATKYVKRVPTGNPKRPWKYFYTESAAAREVKEGETLKLGDLKVQIQKVEDDGTVHIQWPDSDLTKKYLPHEWSRLLTEHYGSVYVRSSERRARQAANAVLRHVPKALLKELKGDTEEERMQDLKKRAPEVYKRLKKAFSRAGMSPVAAKRVIADTLQAQGWNADARAALLGNVLDKKGAWLATNYKRVMRSAQNSLGVDEQVSAAHVQAAVDVLAPGGPLEQRDKLSDAAGKELKKLEKMLKAAEGDPKKAVELLKQALESPALAQIHAMHRAHPEIEIEHGADSAVVVNKIGAVRSRLPGKVGAPTQVYVAGTNGQPVALAGEYRLVEAEEAIPSHDPTSFGKNEAYPEGLQERAYHRDKSEQQKVMRNAQKLKPGFLVNTNPDALNGPPIVNEDGIVLGGNSRTMSMQRVYSDDGAKAQELRTYLKENAYQMGFRPEDVESMKNPVLVRVVNTEDQDQAVLVRAMNESFIQGMDPRTMQVAMGRRLDEDTLKTLANSMKPEQTLRAFLDSKDAENFIGALAKSGIIDDRNRNQYIQQKTGKLNEDGKTLVERILVGRLVEDPDLLSNTRPSMVSALARAVPYMIQAEAYGKSYAIREELKQALHGYNRMHSLGVAPPKGAKKGAMEYAINMTKDSLRDMFEGDHPVNSDPRVEAIFDNLVMRGGPRQIAATFRKYAEQAEKYPEGQRTMLIDKPSPADVFNSAVAGVIKEEQEAKAKEEGSLELFAASMSPVFERLEGLVKKMTNKPPSGYQPIPGSKHGGYRKRKGKSWSYWYPSVGHAEVGDAHALGDTPVSENKKVQTLHDIKRVLTNPKAVASRIGSGAVNTAKEFPMAIKAMGKLAVAKKIDRHEAQALVSVGVIVGTTALYGVTGGVLAGAGAGATKVMTHVAMKAVHNMVDSTYTGVSGADFGSTLMFLSVDAREEAKTRKLIETLVFYMKDAADKMTDQEAESL